MKKLKLQFRAKLPDGSYFDQGNQYLISFLRRATIFTQPGNKKPVHEKYLEKPLENYLEILIHDEWVPCIL